MSEAPGPAEHGVDWEAIEAPYLEWLDEPPAEEGKLVRRTLVRVGTTGRVVVGDSGDLGLSVADRVLIETPAGRELGQVCSPPTLELHAGEPLSRVLRRASGADERRERSLRQRQGEAEGACREEIRRHGLPMKLVAVHLPHGSRKVVVYFGAEGRVDFRSLASDLSRKLRSRVELRQVGARDETRLAGGYGVCGLELCCASWLPGFSPVSIRHAKSQNLEMHLDKLQGVCGRLMCCLVYEHEIYKELRKGLPRVGRTIETPVGEGRVREVNVPLRRIRVQVGPNDYRTFTAAELGIEGPEAVAGVPAASPADEPAQVPPRPAADADATQEGEAQPPWKASPERKRRRRRRGRGGGRGRGGTGGAPPNA